MNNRRKAFGVVLLAAAVASGTVWATGSHRHHGDRHNDRHPSKAHEKNPVFKKLFGSAPSGDDSSAPSGGGSSTPTFDYRNYIEADTVAGKVFATTGTHFSAICGDTESRTYTRQAEATGTRVVETRVRSRTGLNCQFERLEHLATATEYAWQRLDRYDQHGSSLQFSRVMTNPLPVYPGSISAAGSWGSASGIDNGSGVTLVGQVIETSALLGVESSVTVPSGTYNDCLRIKHTRMSNQVGQYSAVSWICAGIGEVKRVEGQNGMMAQWLLSQVDSTP